MSYCIDPLADRNARMWAMRREREQAAERSVWGRTMTFTRAEIGLPPIGASASRIRESLMALRRGFDDFALACETQVVPAVREFEQALNSLIKSEQQRRARRRLRPFFRWYDLWVGAYWDRRERALYVCPLPMVGVRIRFSRELK